MLHMHAQCLRRLGRVDEFLETAFKVIAAGKGHALGLESDDWPVTSLIETSASLQKPIKISLHDHFDTISLDPYVRHHDHQDGFQMTLRFRSLLLGEFEADEVLIEASSDGKQVQELKLAAPSSQTIGSGISRILVGTHVS